MKNFLLIFTLSLIAETTLAQIPQQDMQGYEVRRIEVEPSFGMGRGLEMALEVRNNINAYWDVGIRASMSNVGYNCVIVSDYNLARPNKDFLFFAGAGLGLGEYTESDYVDGPTGTSTQLKFVPRAGIELLQHVRLTLNINTYNFSSVYPIVSLGIVFGGGRK